MPQISRDQRLLRLYRIVTFSICIALLISTTGCMTWEYTKELKHEVFDSIPTESHQGHCYYYTDPAHITHLFRVPDYSGWQVPKGNESRIDMRYAVPEKAGSALNITPDKRYNSWKIKYAAYVFVNANTPKAEVEKLLNEVFKQIENGNDHAYFYYDVEYRTFKNVLLIQATKSGIGTKVTHFNKVDKAWVKHGPYENKRKLRQIRKWHVFAPIVYPLCIAIDIYASPIYLLGGISELTARMHDQNRGEQE